MSLDVQFKSHLKVFFIFVCQYNSRQNQKDALFNFCVILYWNKIVQWTTKDACMLADLHVCLQEESEYLLAKMITLSSIPVSFPKFEGEEYSPHN